MIIKKDHTFNTSNRTIVMGRKKLTYIFGGIMLILVIGVVIYLIVKSQHKTKDVCNQFTTKESCNTFSSHTNVSKTSCKDFCENKGTKCLAAYDSQGYPIIPGSTTNNATCICSSSADPNENCNWNDDSGKCLKSISKSCKDQTSCISPNNPKQCYYTDLHNGNCLKIPPKTSYCPYDIKKKIKPPNVCGPCSITDNANPNLDCSNCGVIPTTGASYCYTAPK